MLKSNRTKTKESDTTVKEENNIELEEHNEEGHGISGDTMENNVELTQNKSETVRQNSNDSCNSEGSGRSNSNSIKENDFVIVTEQETEQDTTSNDANDEDDDTLTFEGDKTNRRDSTSSSSRSKDRYRWSSKKEKDRFGFIISSKFLSRISDLPSRQKTIIEKSLKERVSKEGERESKWIKMTSSKNVFQSYRQNKEKKLKRRIRKGIPDKIRSRAWQLILDVDLEKAKHPNLYEELRDKVLHQEAPNLSIVNTINNDLDRTFPRHEDFCLYNDDNELLHDENGEPYESYKIQQLGRILHAYSRYDEELGYCQGMGFITALMLTYIPKEEDVFFILKLLMERPLAPMRQLYMPGLVLVNEKMWISNNLMRKKVPRIYNHFENLKIHRSMYMTQWIIAIFSNCFPFEFVTRVWDVFLYEGWKVVYRYIIALMQFWERDLLRSDFEGILHFFRDRPPILLVSEIIAIETKAMKLSLSKREISQIESEMEEALKIDPDVISM